MRQLITCERWIESSLFILVVYAEALPHVKYILSVACFGDEASQ